MRKHLVTLSALPLIVLSACGGGDDNAADVTFAQHMIPHHEQAIEMSSLVADRTDNPAVLDLAAQITSHQGPEISTMKGWLDDWDVDASEGHHDMGDMEMGDGMMSEADMTELEGLAGDAFDRAWLAMMIEHHEGAVSMAETVIDDGDDPEVDAFAVDVVDEQTREITLMNRLLKEQP